MKLDERLVAFLDVLGFSRRLATESLEDLHARYASLIDKANETVFSGINIVEHDHGTRLTNFDYAGFHSDSVVLVSKPLSEGQAAQSTFNFVAATTQLLEDGFARSLPFRGCIGVGNVLLDEERRILLSEVLPILLSLEKAQEWAGCIVHPKAETRLLELLIGNGLATETSGLFVRHRVHLKGDKLIEHGLCVNWVAMMSDRDLDAGRNFLEGPKREHTDEFIEHVKQLPGNVQALTVPGSAIVAVRIQHAPSGMRIKFVNATGEGVDPPNGFQLRLAFQRSPESG